MRGKIVDISDFSFSVVTPDNVYDLTITNVVQFAVFGAAYLSTKEGIAAAEEKLDISENTLPADAEIRFLDFISDKGLTLFKPLNSQNSAWGRVQKVNNSIEIKNCHQ